MESEGKKNKKEALEKDPRYNAKYRRELLAHCFLSVFLTNNVYRKNWLFHSLFFAYCCLLWVFLIIIFFIGLLSSHTVAIKETGQNNFIHEMRKSYFNE